MNEYAAFKVKAISLKVHNLKTFITKLRICLLQTYPAFNISSPNFFGYCISFHAYAVVHHTVYQQIQSIYSQSYACT